MKEKIFARYPDLENKSVMITGGASGIGASLVEHFVEQNAKVAFLDIAAEQAIALVDNLSSRYPNPPLFFKCDLTDITELKNSIANIFNKLGPLSVLVNNAGNDDRHEFQDVTPSYWDQRMAVNLKHQFFAAQAVYEGMQSVGGGSIINLSSTSWVMGEGGYVCYTTAKAAVIGFTRSIARDFGESNIRANAILPGWVMTDRQIDLWLTPEAEQQIFDSQALKRKLYPEDVSRMALFLASNDSQMITGQSFIVDGGWS